VWCLNHAILDEVAARVPELHRSLTVRRVVDRMLGRCWRRSAARGNGARDPRACLWSVSPCWPADPAASVARPQREVCGTDGQAAPGPVLHTLIVYSWRLVEPAANDSDGRGQTCGYWSRRWTTWRDGHHEANL
jgi:hypothetical protein